MGSIDVKKYHAALVACRAEVRAFLNESNAGPICIRLAWHDSGAGGADGSIRFDAELAHGANAGLSKAVGYAERFKQAFPILSTADVIQLMSAEAVHLAGGPSIPMRYGRKDAAAAAEEGKLPAGMAPFPEQATATEHLRAVFTQHMGFSDRDIVTLSGAHTMGRAFKERSGATPCGFGAKGTRFTSEEAHAARPDGKLGLGMLGGQSWTQNWLTFDNSYFTAAPTKDLLMLDTDRVIREDPAFKPHFDAYAKSQAVFFEDYADVHRRLSELNSTFLVPGGIALEPMARL